MKKANKKRGLSTVITAMILILLVLTSVGIVWVVIQTVLEDNSELIEYQTECVGIDLRITSIKCDHTGASSICNLSVQRNSGGGDFDGIKIQFSNEDETKTNVIDELGPIQELGKKTYPGISTSAGIDTEIPNAKETRTRVTPYFLTLKGEEIICE